MIDIEEQLTEHLSQRARAATPRPDLAGVTAAPTVVTLRRVELKPSRGRLMIASAAVAVAIIAGAIAVIGQRSTAPASGDADDAQCVVFLHPQASQLQINTAGDALRLRPEVVDLRLVTQEEAFADFLRLFAEKPDIIEFARSDMLPATWRFALDPDTEVVRASIHDELTGEPMVAGVSCRSDSEADESRGPTDRAPVTTMAGPALSTDGARVPPR
jgi:cell division protein FtsX